MREPLGDRSPRRRRTAGASALAADLEGREKDGGLFRFDACESRVTRVKDLDARTLEITVARGATARSVLGPPESVRPDHRPFPPIPTE